MIYIGPAYRNKQIYYDLAWFIGAYIPMLMEPYLSDDVSNQVTAFDFVINA